MFMARASQESTALMVEQPHRTEDRNVDGILKNTPSLPAEIWLQILEHDDHQHLWLSVRNASRALRDRVERLFTSKYLADPSIALSLPRRDPATGKMKWPGDPIPMSQLKLTYSHLNEDGKTLRLESSTVVKDRHTQRSVEELRENGTLPKKRLDEAPAYVNLSTYSFAGITIHMPVQVDWDQGRKIWTWDVEWRRMLRGYYNAKEMRKASWREPCTSGRMRSKEAWIP
ncbi:hypothetical protein E8E12_000728 [Didymella heteroderae]|uniref:F-box domain-containing protein n=1 Tax=Didymella heteroderae TaxID=1769908 RepID=A0A9P4WI74_9PLEO|nr:hypothetical protein E8E12_000728 [Didymella heteroderae]